MHQNEIIFELQSIIDKVVLSKAKEALTTEQCRHLAHGGGASATVKLIIAGNKYEVTFMESLGTILVDIAHMSRISLWEGLKKG